MRCRFVNHGYERLDPMSGIALPRIVRRRAAFGLAVGTALLWLALMLLVAVFADLLRPYSITAIDLGHRLASPLGFGGTLTHPLGTDELGRDVLSRLIVSIRVSLLLAFGATLLALLMGTTLGLLAAHLRGLVEQAVLMLVDFQAALPFMILALAVLAFFGDPLPLFVGAMGLYTAGSGMRESRAAWRWPPSAELRGGDSPARRAGPWRIYLRHVLPNIAATLVVSTTLAFPEVDPAGKRPVVPRPWCAAADVSLGNMVGYGRNI